MYAAVHSSQCVFFRSALCACACECITMCKIGIIRQHLDTKKNEKKNYNRFIPKQIAEEKEIVDIVAFYRYVYWF